VRHNQVIYLQSVTITEDEIGNQIETVTERMVFANELSVSSSEYYDAGLQGIKPAKRWEIYAAEYQGEDRVRYENTVYRIIRTETRGEKIRLTAERVIGNG